MQNHFHTALAKLTTDEVNAVVSPLIAVLQGTLEPGADAGAAREFIEHYVGAVEVNGHEFGYVAPNGNRFDTDAEVAGFSAQRPAEPWRRMAGALTGGKLGNGGQPFTPSTVVVASFIPTVAGVANTAPRKPGA